MTRTLTVTSSRIIKEGVGQKGPWVLRQIEATNEQGEDIAYPLKTFANIPLGRVECELERQDHEKFGVSFMVKPVGNGAPRAAAGGPQLADLEARIARLESEVRRLSGLVDRRDPDVPPSSVPAGVTPGIPDDDDIPF